VQTEKLKKLKKMSGSAKNVYSQVLISVFLVEPPFTQLFANSELIRHLANCGSSSAANNDRI